jgi:hypothetical protein
MPAAILLGIGLAGVASKVVSDRAAGDAQQKAQQGLAAISTSQAAVADYNAHVSDLQAQDAIERGAQDEARYRLQIKSTIGAQRVGFAGGNVDVGFGSPVDVAADTAHTGELDALTIRNNAARTAWGFSVAAADSRSQAAIDRKAAANQIAAGDQAVATSRFTAVTDTLLGGTSLLNTQYGFMPTKG